MPCSLSGLAPGNACPKFRVKQTVALRLLRLVQTIRTRVKNECTLTGHGKTLSDFVVVDFYFIFNLFSPNILLLLLLLMLLLLLLLLLFGCCCRCFVLFCLFVCCCCLVEGEGATILRFISTYIYFKGKE